MKDKIKIKCILKNCLNNEKGCCTEFIPTIIPKLVPSSIKCPYFDTNMEETYNKIKAAGGLLGLILRGKNQMTEEELADVKKSKRKPRADKGQKREKKPKKKNKENNLKELM